ncbi:MAG: vitamin B12-dependent ribonucleotide reductase [Fuerstiella sp.]|nr:vitamin B12-dependent ribonucleotide reductase [Fuerstiella sp.]MCP4858978.1 vitamin B12-dependent ribonucleotide reductase [Fuerstiella sp.]
MSSQTTGFSSNTFHHLSGRFFMSTARTQWDTDDSADVDRSQADSQGLHFDPVFCPTDVGDPFETTQWERRSAEIKDEQGNPLFEQHDCEVPVAWSQLATNVVVNKYFYGEVDTPERETSVRELIHRVTRTIADWGLADGYFATPEDGEQFYRELTWLCLHQHGAFNSPVWFNVGLFHQYDVTSARCTWHWDRESNSVRQPENPYEFPQASACFIQSVDDTMEDIMRLVGSEAMLFKFGSGTGTDLSTLRSWREKLAGGGQPSGPLSFMRVFDQVAGVVKSGGKTRRAAKMQSLQIWHPDVLEFIECKWNEEQKAQTLIASGKYDANFNGDAYSSIAFQNANLSVRLSDEFLESVDQQGQWTTHWVTDPTQPGPGWQSQHVLDRMAECAWHCGDPGVQYDSTINRWHTCPNSGRINASNPCSEYMFLDDSACNLASVNLMKFRHPDGNFDADRFQKACRIFLVAQDILVDRASYPTAQIAENSHRFRPLGLGYANLGGLLMSRGVPYDSEAARGLCGSITAIMHASANLTSTELARAVGTFSDYPQNDEPMNRVMEMHRRAVAAIDPQAPDALCSTAAELWGKVVRDGRRYGFRNAQVTVLAPTGTIGFMMDCATTGIEPDIALVKYKQLAGGGMLKIVNQTVPLALNKLGYDKEQIQSIIDYLDEHDSIEGCPDLDDSHLGVFDCAFKADTGTRFISWRAHIRMMAAAQPFLSGAISKTVNMPNDVTPKEIADAYQWAWRMGLKAIAIYRDGSKQSQPLSTSTADDANKDATDTKPRRERLPDTRQSMTHKFDISGHEGYITIGLYPDGRPGELFIVMAKEGSTVGGLMDSFGTAISICLQYGVPLKVLVNKFSHTRFEPMGFTSDPDIRIAKSLVDYIFRWLGKTFLSETAAPAAEGEAKATDSNARQNGTAAAIGPDATAPEVRSTAPHDHNRDEQFSRFQSDAPSCGNCGSITVRNGNCYLCHNCGNSLGCS